jgi:hypothetical protein
MKKRLAALALVALLTAALAGGLATPASAQTPQPILPFRESIIPLSITCSSQGQLCGTTYTTPRAVTFEALNVRFTAASTHCSSLRVRLSLITYATYGSAPATTEFLSPFLAAGQSTYYSFNPLSPGIYAVRVQGEGIIGGCNSGHLSGWGGTLNLAVGGKERTYSPAVSCNDSRSLLCDPPFRTEISTSGGVVVDFKAPPSNCTRLRLHISVPTGTPGVVYSATSEWLDPGRSMRTMFLPVPAGKGVLEVRGEGEYSCTYPRTGLSSWGGTLKVYTTY